MGSVNIAVRRLVPARRGLEAGGWLYVRTLGRSYRRCDAEPSTEQPEGSSWAAAWGFRGGIRQHMH